ncbi:MAG: DUF4430 domain-containing protein [Candidatus Levybacteria bacterium]|nr:DUF4430 domain-containing protein [Candidatus Levybacteria bacterium]
MEDTNRRFANIFLGLLILGIIGYFSYGFFVAKDSSQKSASFTAPEKPTPTMIVLIDYVQYKGKVGKNALQLLQEQASVEQATSGLVVAINDRKADNAKHEYWGFYVNGKLAQVGPADYQTKDEDVIEWKIEKY